MGLVGLALTAVAFLERRTQAELGVQIPERVGIRGNPSTGEASAVAPLFSTSPDARVPFLSRALNSDAARLRVSEQRLSVALTRVRSADAAALFNCAISPTLAGS